MMLGRMTRADDEFRLDAFATLARYGHGPIVGQSGILCVVEDCDDRVRLDAGRNVHFSECLQKGAVPGHVVDAARHVVEPAQEDPVVVLEEEIGGRVDEFPGKVHHARCETTEPSLGEEASLVRGRDEDHALDEGKRLEEERSFRDLARFWLEVELVDGSRADELPEGVAAVDDAELGEQAAV